MRRTLDHAVVYGASGIIGWSIVEQILRSYPESKTFSKVTAASNRPVDLSTYHWPEPSVEGPLLDLVSGIDLRQNDSAAFTELLREKMKDVHTVTHVYYTAYSGGNNEDEEEELRRNRQMFRNVVDAHTSLSPDLQFVSFPGGARGYGIYAPGGTFSPPLVEDMVKDLPAEVAKVIVYKDYREILTKASQGKQWTWCEVCPDAIIGFTPNGSQFSLALHWGQFLSLFAYNHGVGPHTQNTNAGTVKVPYPGTAASASALCTPVSSKTIARFMIYASLHPEECGGGELFNIADNATPTTLGEIWVKITEWFGLVGTLPAATSANEQGLLAVGQLPRSINSKPPGQYIEEYQDVFVSHGCHRAAVAGVGIGHRQLDSVGYWLVFDRQLSLEKVRNTRFQGDKDPLGGWLEAFEKFRSADLIL